MPVAKEHTGTYRQVAAKLRIQKDPGAGPHKESFRPRRGKRGPFLDSDDEPTLIEIEADDACDVPGLLKLGAIVPYERPSADRPQDLNSMTRDQLLELASSELIMVGKKATKADIIAALTDETRITRDELEEMMIQEGEADDGKDGE